MTKNFWIKGAYILISLTVIITLLVTVNQYDRSIGPNKTSLFFGTILVLFTVPKLVITVFLIGEDITRLVAGGYQYVTQKTTQAEVSNFFASRRKFISQVALGVAAIPFASIFYGVFRGKYNFKVISHTIYFDDLPEGFEDFKITHISDIHSGSFDNHEKVEYAIELMNKQKTDIVLFTGDIVNTKANEMDPWIDTFKKIKTPKYGKFSVLGNHDYGEYVSWPSEEEKEKNFNEIKGIHEKIDFKLLLNENITLNKGQDKITLIGVENWGHNFKKAGDLKKASESTEKEDFKILMTHDPSHWEKEVKQHEHKYQLTLSGHTHGLQFGIEIPGFFQWSPSQYVYKQWAGLYQEFGNYINVNRGFGFHGYSARVGIWPEITVIKLKNSKNKA
ncbi:MAG: metallophosphoesterase [Flavobacteriales bacterium]